MMNWGAKIVLSFVCFFGVIFTMAYISMNQDINLVADNYYEQELAYEDQIERIKNTQGLSEKPQMVLDRVEREARLVFPNELIGKVSEGKVHFFRPSNSALDKEFTIVLDQEGFQAFDISAFPAGLWKAKVSWEWKNREYYEEITIVL